MDRCVQPLGKALSHKLYWIKSLDMKSMPCNSASVLSATATENANLTALLKTKGLYFTHMATWQTPSREATETYTVSPIIPIP